VIAAQLCAEVFNAQYAEIRVASGAMANLYSFMALTAPGDDIIVPPATIGGHVTHHVDGCAGLFGLFSHNAPIDHDGYSVNLLGLAKMAARIRSKLINIGGSLNLFAHPVRELRQIADNVGAKVLFDAAHQCHMIAGRAWATPPSGGRPCYDHEQL
jgi:glycine hydroxymethyltransferase